MTTFAQPPHFWSTACDDRSTDTLPGDLSALGEHLDHCQSTHRHLLTMHCMALSMRGFVEARFVTTVVLVVIFFGVNIWLF
jgi:hypothetical protein